jgi:ActR/RegA family two-component response regulator
MSNILGEASILLLDDQTQYLKTAQVFFQEKGVSIDTAQSCDNVMEAGQKGTYDIILSDLDLHNISEHESGLTVLEKIRDHNTMVFLGLYTAYEYTLTKSQRNRLEGNGIKIYRKDDPDAFLEDLISDYEAYQQEKENDKDQLTELVFFQSIRKDVLNHLGNISNQEVLVPVSNLDEDVTVKDLYTEVLNNSKIGRRFMMDWYENMKFITDLKSKRRNGK